MGGSWRPSHHLGYQLALQSVNSLADEGIVPKGASRYALGHVLSTGN
jgi:hypothetical protein